MDKKQQQPSAWFHRRYDPSERYKKDYLRLFRDQLGVPESRLQIIKEGPDIGSRINGRWTPRRSRITIYLEHGGFLSVIYLGDWDAWVPRRKAWVLTKWYGGTAMPSDGSGPYELKRGPRHEFIPLIRRLLEIDKERTLTIEDIQEKISTKGRRGH